MMKHQKRFALATVALFALACSGGSASNGAAPAAAAPAPAGTTSAAVRLQGAGSTFDTPLFSRVFDSLQKQHGIEVNYQSIGSGGGVQQLISGTVDFGASDFPLNDEQTKAADSAGGPVVHIPVTMGAVSIGYNVPVGNLKLDGATLSGIYMGTIRNWNDSKIAALNAGATLPNLPIVVVHRSEGSGTTFIFTSYLSAVNPEWKSKVGAAGSVKWPTGIGAKGSEGVSGQVTTTPGAIGYFELAYAKSNNIKSALLKNAAGTFVEPSSEGAAAAGAGSAAKMPADLKAVFVNAPGAASYPIAGFSWIIVFKNQKDAAKGQAIVDMLKYTVTEGQQGAAALYYAPLPKAVQDLALKAIATIQLP
ncbi:MAG TPA: phosphate ABC transporter substrate-binding protein PstS [Vicinamibacterales bacterium]|jgi:phosphate transport system substrate-binding protein